MREDAIYKKTRGFYGRSHVLLHRTVADKTQFRKHGIFADEQKGGEEKEELKREQWIKKSSYVFGLPFNFFAE